MMPRGSPCRGVQWWYVAGFMLAALGSAADKDTPCSPPLEGFYTYFGFEAPLKFDQPGAAEYLVLNKNPVLENLYKGTIVIIPAPAPSLRIPGQFHGVFDPEACEMYGILFTPSTGFNLPFVYRASNDSMIGLDVSRNFRLRPASAWGMHIFSYQGPGVDPAFYVQ